MEIETSTHELGSDPGVVKRTKRRRRRISIQVLPTISTTGKEIEEHFKERGRIRIRKRKPYHSGMSFESITSGGCRAVRNADGKAIDYNLSYRSDYKRTRRVTRKGRAAFRNRHNLRKEVQPPEGKRKQYLTENYRSVGGR